MAVRCFATWEDTAGSIQKLPEGRAWLASRTTQGGANHEIRHLRGNANAAGQIPCADDLGNPVADRTCRSGGLRRVFRHRPSLLSEILHLGEPTGSVRGRCPVHAAHSLSRGSVHVAARKPNAPGRPDCRGRYSDEWPPGMRARTGSCLAVRTRQRPIGRKPPQVRRSYRDSTARLDTGYFFLRRPILQGQERLGGP